MSGHKLIQAAAAIAFAAGLSGAAFAQTTPVQQPRDPNMPAPHNTVPEKIEPNATGSTGGTLSDKLERSDGVVTPPGAADSTIKTIRPAPDAGTMPVIPPPGSPGGNQSVQPK